MTFAIGCHVEYDTHQTCDKNDVISSKIISIQEAKTLSELSDRQVIIEVSKSDEYSTGHLPNAINVWRPDFRSKTFLDYGGMICSPSEMVTFLQSTGITDTSSLLLYDNKGGCDAMRLAWVFDYYGFDHYKVINGGKTSWVQNGYELDTAVNTPIHNHKYTFTPNVDSSIYATIEDVKIALNDTKTIIIDTRETYEYLGEPFISGNDVLAHKNGAYERGCIPDAIHLNWSEMSDLADDHRIKCTKDLIHNLEQKGITKDKNVIVYCQSGSRSSHTAFVLRELLEYPSVKNYDGSWIEWSYYYKNKGDVPITKLTDDAQFKELEFVLLNKLKTSNG